MGPIVLGIPEIEGPPISYKMFVNGVLKKETRSVSNFINLSIYGPAQCDSLDGC